MTCEAETPASAAESEARLAAGHACRVEDAARVLGSDTVASVGGQAPGRERAVGRGPRAGLALWIDLKQSLFTASTFWIDMYQNGGWRRTSKLREGTLD